MHWDIEMFFKVTKSLLKPRKEFQGRLYDGVISHIPIGFSRYIVLAWKNRCNTDERILGGLFYELCDEVNELDWASSRCLKTNQIYTQKKCSKINYSNGWPVYPVISRLICRFHPAKVE